MDGNEMAELILTREPPVESGDQPPMVTSLRQDKDIFFQREAIDHVLAVSTANVSPGKMAAVYQIVGKLRALGSLLLLLTSIDAWLVIYFAGVQKRTDKAIQVIYDYQLRLERLIFALGDALWQGSKNTRSVRARGIFVTEFFSRIATMNKWMNVASLGSGSARPLLKGLVGNDSFGGKVHLVDTDARSLGAGEEYALAHGICTELHEERADAFLRQIKAGSIDIFEVVGLLDYFKDATFRMYAKKIFHALSPGGIFVGANISSREEYDYAHYVARWPRMYYRDERHILAVLEGQGFRVWTGQCGLYTVWVAQKPF